MIDFIPTPYKLIGLAIGAAIIFALGYLKGHDSANEKHIAYKTEVAAQQAILEANAEKARVDTQRLAADTAAGWSAAVDYWRNRSGRVVRVQPPAGCDQTGLRPLPSTTGLTPPTGSELELGAAVSVAVEQCEALLNKAVMDAAMLTHLQEWVKQQHEVQR